MYVSQPTLFTDIPSIVQFSKKLSMPKDSFRELIEKAGYSYSDNITKETTYLIADDVNGNSSKLKKAQIFGIWHVWAAANVCKLTLCV